MFGYGRVVAGLILAMCSIRFGVAIFAYAAPETAFATFNLVWEERSLLFYFVKVWAIRDMAIAALILFSGRNWIAHLLTACVFIETSDIVSTYLAMERGLFTFEEAQSQASTAVLALILELFAILLIKRHRIRASTDPDKMSLK